MHDGLSRQWARAGNGWRRPLWIAAISDGVSAALPGRRCAGTGHGEPENDAVVCRLASCAFRASPVDDPLLPFDRAWAGIGPRGQGTPRGFTRPAAVLYVKP